MQRILNTLTSLYILLMMPVAFGERVPLYSNEEINIQNLIKTLKEKTQEFDSMLKAREQLAQWESRIKQLDLSLHQELQDLKTDQEKVRTAQMSKDAFEKKWGTPQREKKITENVKSFEIELKNYNAKRESYHQLANKLARYLQHRKPEDVRELVKAMILLTLDLEKAVSNGDYKVASSIATRSTLATEFGFPSKN